MADEGMTPETATSDGDGKAPVPLLDDMRQELDHAADDLERLTTELQARTELVEGFEALVDELLNLLSVPVVVVDENARITGLSRGAADLVDDPANAVGRAASSVLPARLSTAVVAFVRDGGRRDEEDAGAAGDDEGDRAGAGDGAVRFLPLPGRSTLVVVGG
jgi:nitrogen fixation/metabolism regulation signal transduction histidine kinase